MKDISIKTTSEVFWLGSRHKVAMAAVTVHLDCSLNQNQRQTPLYSKTILLDTWVVHTIKFQQRLIFLDWFLVPSNPYEYTLFTSAMIMNPRKGAPSFVVLRKTGKLKNIVTFTFVFFPHIIFNCWSFSIFLKITLENACLTIDLSIPARSLLSSQSVRRIGCFLFRHLVRLSISRCCKLQHNFS